DFKIDITLDQGMHAKAITLPLKPFCLIGATTRAGLLSGPMRSRFGIGHNLDFYSGGELLKILHRSADLLKLAADDTTLRIIAARSRGTPRICNRLLRRARDYAQVKNNGRITPQSVDQALQLEGVDALGLDELDRKYLRIIAEIYNGGPVGLEAIAATLGEDSGTLEELCEPYLLQIGFLARTRQGRQLTPPAAEHLHLKISPPKATDPLFE
ncbi:MAG: Holliday junction branch migration DNA helicase RuvB, partial [Phycisphaeraceae bacterium]|nr:Holliday junction branch migration DNA helicase RuvB [Phycisphaeraceae bacterium]